MSLKVAKFDRNSLDEFTRAYIEAALWSSTDDEGEALDKYSIEDIAPESLEAMVKDCEEFQKQNEALIDDEGDYSSAGHDFWLTRVGHGAGFWDGDWPTHGDELTKASKAFGHVDLYVGDDGYIYQAGTEKGGAQPPREEHRYDPTTDDAEMLKAFGIQQTAAQKALAEMGLTAHIESSLLRKKEASVSTDFDPSASRKYDWEAHGNDAILISPSHITEFLTGEKAKLFWDGLDTIENEVLDTAQHETRVQEFISSFFKRESDAEGKLASDKSRFLVKVDATKLNKSASSFVSGVDYKEGKVEKVKLTTNRSKAASFSHAEANQIEASLSGFELTGNLIWEERKPNS